MKQIQLPSGSYLLVEVPEHINKIVWEKGNEGEVLWMFSERNRLGDHKRIRLNPSGQWSIIGKADELKEEDLRGIVETVQMPNEPMYYKGYGDVDYVATTNAIQSGLSLIASHNMKPSETLILKLN